MDGVPELAAALLAEYRFLGDAVISRLVRSYGTRARVWLADARSTADLGKDFGHGLYQAEVDYLINTEWAQSAEDILWRRSKLGLRFTDAERANLSEYVGTVANKLSV